ncbi:MAG: endonuclease NucS [Propionibacteriaceae bacterium]|nr:endonuclease NucS [Propionibacteriaceae bacterium]
MRLLIADCQVDYTGRLSAHLPKATRLIMVKADGSVSIHADDRAYKPLNWMSAPCTMRVSPGADDEISEVWEVSNTGGDLLRIQLFSVASDASYELGVDPGLEKDGVEAHLQVLLAANPQAFGVGWQLVQREYFTPIGPVDLLFRDDSGGYVAVEVKRRGEIDGVEQLTRYLELMNADPLLSPVRGVFAAQVIKPQARVLAGTRGIGCLLVDYDALRGLDNAEDRLF